jgi:hypothetical protein
VAKLNTGFSEEVEVVDLAVQAEVYPRPLAQDQLLYPVQEPAQSLLLADMGATMITITITLTMMIKVTLQLHQS